MELNCPYCDASTKRHSKDPSNGRSDSMYSYYMGVTCTECDRYYEIAYKPNDILFWPDDADGMRMKSSSVTPYEQHKTK